VITSSDVKPGLDPSDIWVYQILKQDPYYGDVGLRAQANNVLNLLGSGFQSSFDIIGTLGDEYQDGYFTWTNGGVAGLAYIGDIETLTIAGNAVTRIYTTTRLSGGSPSLPNGTSVYLRKANSVSWDPAELNGVPVIVYEYDAGVTHPVTATLGAYIPVQPDSVNGNALTFTGKLLPLPDRLDNNNNVGAYGIVAPGQARLVATGVDPVTGKTITSNVLRVNLALPEYLTGVTASNIPVGWTVGTDESTGNGLNGANFITINYQSGSSLFGVTITSIFP